MALSKEFYLDEIRSKYPNSYNESLKDLPVKDLEDMLDFLDQALGKADGGAIGIEVLFTEKKPRKNFFMGGPALEGEALSVYNSMSAYGFSDQEIANALKERGLYTPGGATTPVINTAPNIINQGGDGNGGGGRPKGGLGLSRFDYGYKGPSMTLADEGEGTILDEDYTLGMRLGDLGTGIKGGLAKAYQDLRSLPTPFNIASRAMGNISDFFKKQAAEKKAREEKAAQAAFEKAMSQGASFYDQFGKGDATSTATRETAGTGYDSLDPGTPFAKGGLATMFKPRRR